MPRRDYDLFSQTNLTAANLRTLNEMRTDLSKLMALIGEPPVSIDWAATPVARISRAWFQHLIQLEQNDFFGAGAVTFSAKPALQACVPKSHRHGLWWGEFVAHPKLIGCLKSKPRRVGGGTGTGVLSTSSATYVDLVTHSSFPISSHNSPLAISFTHSHYPDDDTDIVAYRVVVNDGSDNVIGTDPIITVDHLLASKTDGCTLVAPPTGGFAANVVTVKIQWKLVAGLGGYNSIDRNLSIVEVG